MKQRKKPALRFKGFVNDWEQRKLGELMEVGSVKRVHQSDWRDSGVRFLRARDVVAEYKNEQPDDYLYIDERMYNAYSALSGKVQKGDLLVTGVGTIGIPMLIKSDKPVYFKDGNIIWFKNKNAINGDFFYYAFISSQIQNFIKETAGTGTVGTYTIASGKKTPIALPVNRKEQEQIGAYIGGLDNLITLHQRKLEKLQNLKKAMLEKMFPQNGAKVPEIRFKGFTNDWEQRKLGELAGKTYGGGTPRTSEKTFWNGQVPWFQSSDLIEDKVLSAIPKKKITEKGLQKSAAQLIPENSIAIITRVGVGKLAFIPFSYSTSQDFLSLSALNIDGKFGCYSIYKLLQREKNLTQGTSIKGITKKELLRKILWIPCQDEQIKIGRYIANIDNLITLHQRKLRKLQNLKKAMLEKMFI